MVTFDPDGNINSTSGGTNEIKSGWKITVAAGQNITIDTVTLDATSGATQIMIYESDKTTQVGTTISRGGVDTVNINIQLTAGQTYYLVCDDNGSSFTHRFGTQTMPYSDSNLSLVAGVNNGDSGTNSVGSDDSTKMWHFESLTYTLVSVYYDLTTLAVGGGSITGAGSYLGGTDATVTAYPNTGSYFSEWLGDLTGNTNPDSLTMNADKVVSGVFLEQQAISGVHALLRVI